MAKDKTKVDDFDFDDDLGFDDYDFGGSEGSFSADSKKSKKDRGVIGDVFTGVLKGAKDEALQAEFVVDGLKGALPEQYETVFATVDDIAKESTALYDDAINKIKPAAANAARKIDRLIPEESKFLKKLSNKFKDITGAGQEGVSGPSKEDRDNETIANELSQIFGAQQEKEDQVRTRDKSEQRVKDYVEDKRRGRELQLTSGMARDLGSLKTFQDRITTKYYQKSLELQMRSYFLQAEAMKSQQELGNVMQRQLESIVKNTSLPEYAKITDWERIKNQGKERFVNGFFDKGSPIKRLFGKIRSDTQEYVDGLREGLTSIGDLAGELAEMDQLQQEMAQYGFEADSKTKQFASMGGAAVAKGLRNKVTGRIRKSLEGTKLDAKGWEAYVKAKNFAGYGNDQIEDKDSYLNSLKSKLGFKGAAGAFLDYIAKGVKENSIDSELTKRDGIDVIQSAAKFTNKFTRTVEEVIPSLLTEILFSVSNGKRMTFDFERGKLITSKEKSDHFASSSKEKMKSSSSLYYSDKMYESLMGDSKVNSGSEKELRDFLMTFSMGANRTFEQDTIKRSGAYQKLSDEAKRELEKVFTSMDADDFKYKKIAQIQDYSDKFNADFADQRKHIDLLNQIGDGDELVAAGLIKVDEKGKRTIDTDALISNRVSVLSGMRDTLEEQRKIRNYKVNDFGSGQVSSGDKSSSRVTYGVSSFGAEEEAPKSRVTYEAKDFDEKSDTTVGDFIKKKLRAPSIAYFIKGMGSADERRRSKSLKLLREVDAFLIEQDPLNLSGEENVWRRGAIERQEDNYEQASRGLTSDVNTKTEIAAPDSRNSKFTPKNILEKFRNSKVFSWRYKKEFGNPDTHLGPMAQDIKEQFGEKAAPGGTSIDAVTMNGINMMAIQELDRKVDEMGEKASNKNILNAIRMNTFATQAKLDNIGNLSISLGNMAQGLLSNASTALGTGIGAGQELSAEAFAKLQGIYGAYSPTVAGSLKNLGGSIYDLGVAGYEKGKEGLKRGLAGARYAKTKSKRFLRRNVFTETNKERLKDLSKWVYDNTVDGVKSMFSFVKDALTVRIPNALETVKNTINSTIKGISDEINGPCDVYVAGEEDPVMTAKRMKRGLYRDSITGNRIFNRNDLLKSEGAIEDMKGEVVLTQEQIADGIYAKIKGDLVPIRKNASRLGHFVGGAAIVGAKWLKDRALSTFGKARDFGQGALERSKNFFKGVGGYFDEKLSKFSMGTGEYDERIFRVLVEMRGLMRGESPERFEDTVGTKEKGSAPGTTVASGTLAAPTSAEGRSTQSSSQEEAPDIPDRPQDTNNKANMDSISGLGSMLMTGGKGIIGAGKGLLAGLAASKGAGLKGRSKAALLSGLAGGKEAILGEDKDKTVTQAEQPQEQTPVGTIGKLLSGITKLVAPKSENATVAKSGPRAFNDTDGDGLREGAWQEKIAEQERKKQQRESREVAKASNDPQYTNSSFSLGSLMGKAGGFMTMASGLLAGAAEFLGMGALAEKLRRKKDPKGIEAAKKKAGKITAAGSIAEAKKKGFVSRNKGKLAILAALGFGLYGTANAAEKESSPVEDEDFNEDEEIIDEKDPVSNKEQDQSKDEPGFLRSLWDGAKEDPIGTALEWTMYGSLAKGGYDWIRGKMGKKDSPGIDSGLADDLVPDEVEKPSEKKRTKNRKQKGGSSKDRRARNRAGNKQLRNVKTAKGGWNATSDVKNAKKAADALKAANNATKAAQAASAAKTIVNVASKSRWAVWGARALVGLTNPVGLAITAGTVGYLLYKYLTKNSIDDFQKIRFLQYGFSNGDHQKKLNNRFMALEDYLSENRTQKRPDGTWQFNQAALKISELMEIMDLDPKDREQKDKFEEWFTNRFQPYFLAHWTVMKQLAPKLKQLADISSADNEVRLSYLKKITFDNGPMDVIVSPFPEFPFANSNLAEVDLIIKKKIEEISGYLKPKNIGGNPMRQMMLNKKKEEEAEAAMTAEEKDKAAQALKEKSELAEKQFDPSRDKKSSAISKEHQHILDWAKRQSEEGKAPAITSSALNEDKLQTTSEMMPSGTASGGLNGGANGFQYLKFNKPGINIDGLNPEFTKLFLGMAQEYGELTGKKLLITSGTRTYEEQAKLHRENPKKAAPPGRSLHEKGLAIDIDSKNLNELDKLGLMKKYGFTRPVGGETWHMEPAGIQININKAKQDSAWAGQMIANGVGRGGGGYGTVPKNPVGGRSPELALKLLNLDAGKMFDHSKDKATGNLPTPVFEKDRPAANDASISGTPSAGVTMAAAASAASVQTQGATVSSGLTADPDLEPKPQTPQGSPKPEKTGGEFTVAPGGMSTFSGGLGQSYEQGDIKDIVSKSARRAGMDPKMMLTFAAKESSLNPNAKAKTSSAKGLFQFLNKTWDWIVSSKGKKYGIDSKTSPFDPEASTLMASEYLKQNLSSLKGISSAPGIVEGYLTHFLGPGGARTFLKASPNSIAAQVMPEAANANKSIFYEGGKPRTISQVYNTIASQLEKTSKDFGIGGNISKNMESVNGVDNATEFFTSPNSSSAAKTTGPQKSTFSPTVVTPAKTVTTEDLNKAFQPAASNYSQSVQSAPQVTNVKEESHQSFDSVQKTLDESLRVQEEMLNALKSIVTGLDPKAILDLLKKASEDPSKFRPTNVNPSPQNAGTQLPAPSFNLKRGT